jgi:tRNA threonylcarbamoyladenosine biosynthesis protein TsaE
MMQPPYTIDNETKLAYMANKMLATFKNSRVFIFSGILGSGKTTFIKYICKELGVTAGISSPTFSLVNEYQCVNGSVVYHFDFYRIRDVQEAYDIGYEEYFYSGNYCFIEWPEKIPGLVPTDAVEVNIEILSDGKRNIYASAPTP